MLFLKSSGFMSAVEKPSQGSRTFLIILFYAGTFVLFLLGPGKVYAQNPQQPIPDGTEGEFFPRPYDSLKNLSKKDKWENWNEFDGPLTTLKFGLGFMESSPDSARTP